MQFVLSFSVEVEAANLAHARRLNHAIAEELFNHPDVNVLKGEEPEEGELREPAY